jgi:ABC-2 type transport system ATP-binding protein
VCTDADAQALDALVGAWLSGQLAGHTTDLGEDLIGGGGPHEMVAGRCSSAGRGAGPRTVVGVSVARRLRGALARLRGRPLVAAAAVAVLLAGLAGWAAWPSASEFSRHHQLLTVASGPDGATPVDLDTTLYLPEGASRAGPVPAVLLAHGFGGTRHSVAGDAEELVGRGYAVLAWTARGFGASGGRIHLNHPDYEVRDAQRLLDWLARRPEIRTAPNGDPVVGVVGGSYGGALALLLAAQDRRVDAIVPMMTWHDLARAFLPEATGRDPEHGVFKRAWAGLFFGSATGGPGALSGLTGAGASGGAPTRTGGDTDPACGRFAADICRLYQRVAAAGRADPAAVVRLRESSPAGVLDRITAPTLLIQGGADTLFPLSEADANARGIAAAGTPVRVAWFTGGHDGGAGPQSDQDRLRRLTGQWLDHYLAGRGDPPGFSFTWSRVSGFSAVDQGVVTTGYAAGGYPGLAGAGTQSVPVAGPAQQVANPPAGTPAAVSSLPAAGGLASFVNGIVTDLPGQHARFSSGPLPRPIDIVGAPTIRLRAGSPAGEAVLFVKLYDVDESGVATLAGGLVAPVRLTDLPAELAGAEPVTVTLPAIARRIEAGHTLRVTVATSDQAYATPPEPAVHTVAVDGPVRLPTVAGTPLASPEAAWRWVLAGLLAGLAAGIVIALAIARRRRRRSDPPAVQASAAVPLVVRGLRKVYGDGLAAVSHVDLTVARGQVVGLLGPNGAGKTTALRVLVGLARPTAGEVRLFGHRLTLGAPVLSRVGVLVEGPGFLPHLSGMDNLIAFWRATGRPPADARLAEAVEVAGLGDSIHRKVRAYSHGMKQRLAIAQAMLGQPELLILDEPTDGLDPPQIAEMRRVLRQYATGGRAVLVSSHLLAEVEQTCTHVVVMHKGEVVAAGPVGEVVGESSTVSLDVSDVAAASAVLERLPGVRSVTPDGPSGLAVELDGVPRAQVVAALVAAGVGVDRMVPRRRLEDAFLSLVGEGTRGGGDR